MRRTRSTQTLTLTTRTRPTGRALLTSGLVAVRRAPVHVRVARTNKRKKQKEGTTESVRRAHVVIHLREGTFTVSNEGMEHISAINDTSRIAKETTNDTRTRLRRVSLHRAACRACHAVGAHKSRASRACQRRVQAHTARMTRRTNAWPVGWRNTRAGAPRLCEKARRIA